MRKLFSMLLTVVISATLFAGCGRTAGSGTSGGSSTNQTKEKVVVACWGESDARFLYPVSM